MPLIARAFCPRWLEKRVVQDFYCFFSKMVCVPKVFFISFNFKRLVDAVSFENSMVSVPTHAPKNRMLLPLERGAESSENA